VTITATRTGGSSGAVGVSYATSDSTATAGSDYTAASGTLSWANGDTANKTFTVSIAKDSVYEGNETFTITLKSPSGGAILGNPGSAAVTITDDDEAPIVVNVIKNAKFEKGRKNWTASSTGIYPAVSEAPGEALNGNGLAVMGGAESLSEYLYQDVKIPADATEALLDFWYNIETAESPDVMHDLLKILILRPDDNVLLAKADTLSNLNMTHRWAQSQQYDLMAFRGQQIRLKFKAKNDSLNPTTFSLDDVSLAVTRKINLDSPNGEEIIPAGSTYDIQFRKAPEISTVKLKYTLNNGMTWKTIASGIAGTSYPWSVPIPSKAKTKCKIKVIGYDAFGNKVGQDDSDETFTISP
jgi:hypothetical protein